MNGKVYFCYGMFNIINKSLIYVYLFVGFFIFNEYYIVFRLSYKIWQVKYILQKGMKIFFLCFACFLRGGYGIFLFLLFYTLKK